MAQSSTPAVEKLQEYCTNAGVKPRVDQANGIIFGVKIIGTQSRNKGARHYSYPPAMLAKAAPLYEGVVSNVNHHKAGEAVPYQDRIGLFRNVVAKEDGLYGDFCFNPKHSLAEQLCWDAANAPEKLGFSHIADGVINRSKPNAPVVEEITVVDSVDLVSTPATTRGMFESTDELPDGQREFAEHGLSAVSDARTILLSNDSLETKTARLAEILTVWSAELTGVTKRETAVMEWKDITEADLRANRKDLVEVLTGTDATSKLTAEVKTLTEAVVAKDKELQEAIEKLAAVEREKEAQAKSLAIAEELKAAKLDASNKTVVSEAFLSILNAAPDAAARKTLIEDRLALAGCLKETAGSGGPFVEVGGGAKGTAKTTKEFLERV